MIARQRAVISSSASSQLIGANLPSPLAPIRRSGVSRRSGECTSSASRLTLAQANPAVNGCSGSPSMRTHPAVLDLGQQRAHVRAIMRANDANRFQNTTSRSAGRF